MVQNQRLDPVAPAAAKSVLDITVSNPHYKLHKTPAHTFKGHRERTGATWGLERLEFVRMIGRGYASRVWQCTDTLTNSTVAVKVYHKSDLCPLNHHQIHREAQIHSSINHPNVLPFLGSFSDPENVYMVLQHCPKGDLYSYLKQKGRALSENQAAKYVVVPFLSTLAHLHTSGIIHRDIKPENILVTDSGSLQLADFGLSIRSQNDAPVTRVGTLDYMAPEVVNCPRKRNPQDWKDRKDLHYSSAVDVWALGVLVYELCLGEPPFSGETKEAVQQAIQHTEPDYSQLSDACAAFVRLCLSKDARQRPTATQLQSHPWLRPYSSPRPSSGHSASASGHRSSSRTAPNGVATVMAPRRPPTPPMPVSGGNSLPPMPLPCAVLPQDTVTTGVTEPRPTPSLPIASLHGGPSIHCQHGSLNGNGDGNSSPMSTMNTYSDSPDIAGIMSGLKGDVSNLHASVGLDTGSESLAMEPQASYASSSCMSSMQGQLCMHGEQTSTFADPKAPKVLVPQSSEQTYMPAMHANDSKSTLSRETSALDHGFSSVGHSALPQVHTPHSSVFTGESTDSGWQQHRHSNTPQAVEAHAEVSDSDTDEVGQSLV